MWDDDRLQRRDVFRCANKGRKSVPRQASRYKRRFSFVSQAILTAFSNGWILSTRFVIARSETDAIASAVSTVEAEIRQLLPESSWQFEATKAWQENDRSPEEGSGSNTVHHFWLLFQTRHGKPLSQSNILRRYLHPALEEAGFEKSGAHAFRRYRNTFLRSTSCPLTLINYWLGWAGDSMSEHYDRSVLAAKFRKEVANRVGVGLDVPAQLNLIAPKTEQVAEVGITVTA